MLIQVSAHGFELTQSLKDACEKETKDKLAPIALQNIKAKWVLSVQREDQIAHLTWQDGTFQGDVTVKTTDMYNTIHQCAKKAFEQIKKSHEKKQNHHKDKTFKEEFDND